MDPEEMERAKGLCRWIVAARTMSNYENEEVGSKLSRVRKSYAHIKDNSFAWALNILDQKLTLRKKPKNVASMGAFSDATQKISAVMQQQTESLARAANALHVVPTLLKAPTKAALGTFSENHTAKSLALVGLKWTDQDKVPTIWTDFLAEPNKTAKLSFLQTRLSFDSTNDVEMNAQTTHQHVKDLESLFFGRGCKLLCLNSNEGMSPTNCIPLTEEEVRNRDAEEEARLHATSTTTKHYKPKKKICQNFA